MSPARSLLLGAVVAALVLAGCGSDDPASAPDDCTQVDGAEVTLVARNLQWSTECLQVHAGGDFTFILRNEDDGVKHDLEVYGNGLERVKTPLKSGPSTQILDVSIPEPGTYTYVCTIHAQMEGDLFADPSPG